MNDGRAIPVLLILLLGFNRSHRTNLVVFILKPP